MSAAKRGMINMKSKLPTAVTMWVWYLDGRECGRFLRKSTAIRWGRVNLGDIPESLLSLAPHRVDFETYVTA